MRYIGCKKLLLENLEAVINENVDEAEVFCDIFSGTACVSQYFKKKYKIISNDLMYFSYSIQKATVENNKTPEFRKLKLNPIEFFNSLTPEQLEALETDRRFCQNNYSPNGNRMYLNSGNALRIDFIRNKTGEWKEKKLISESEYYYLLAVLIEAVPFVSNISGTYGAYNKFWDKRSLKTLTLKPLTVFDNGKQNLSFNENGNRLIERISGDILYIDPPYNTRQYSSNYHVLEQIARYDFPKLSGVTGQREEGGEKSLYCKRATALNQLEDLIKKAKFTHILLSYNNEGLMSISDIESVLKKYAIKFKKYEIPYRRFKSRETKRENGLCELIFYIRKGK